MESAENFFELNESIYTNLIADLLIRTSDVKLSIEEGEKVYRADILLENDGERYNVFISYPSTRYTSFSKHFDNKALIRSNERIIIVHFDNDVRYELLKDDLDKQRKVRSVVYNLKWILANLIKYPELFDKYSIPRFDEKAIDDIINSRDSSVKSKGSKLSAKLTARQPEYSIDEKGKIVYGQVLGDEIKDYDVFFMPQSFSEAIGKNGIANEILKILGIPHDYFQLQQKILDEQGFQWLEWYNKKVDEHKNFCFILSRNKSKDSVGFSEALKKAVLQVSRFNADNYPKPLKIFIPFIGAGSGNMKPEESLRQVLVGVKQMLETFDRPLIRINFPLKAISEDIESYKNIIKKELHRSDIIDPIYESRIARITGDHDEGDDHLKIDKDVEAFAKIIASSNFVPPLAIALFGEWGSGKSFFMKKLMDKIDHYAKNEKSINSPTFCKGIAQIHFNAWSYLDNNLFASIVSEVFDKLDQYITGDNNAKKEQKEIEDELAEKLQSVKEQQHLLISKKRENEREIELLATSIHRAKKELEKEAKAIKSNTFDKIIAQIEREYEPKEKLKEALKPVTINNQPVNFDEPEQALKELKSTRLFVLNFMRLIIQDRNNLIWLGLAVLIVITLSVLSMIRLDLNLIIPEVLITLIAPLPIIWKGIQKTIEFLSPIIEKVTIIKNEYDNRIKTAQSRFEQYEKASRIEIEQKRYELNLFDHKKAELSRQADEIDHLLKHKISQKAMYSFILKRSSSEDYKKHLGIISTIRKDFETLSDLFDKSNTEYKSFREQFAHPLERIVLYVDDLDRCTEEKVIEVLEAVNLLFGFSTFCCCRGG
jgi:hypothetical protein